MHNIMSGLQGEQCLIYMDDIIVYSSSLEEHMHRLENVFKRLDECNLKLQTDKCEFLRKEVAYLGHLVTNVGVKPDPNILTAVKKFPNPTNVSEIKQFLDLTGYYQRFISNYSAIVKPLTNLLKKDTPFIFNDECVK